MAKIRSLNEIILNSLDFFRVAQPRLDTKPGTVSRDLFIENQASQLAKLYEEVNRVSIVQSPRMARGADLERWGQNIGASKIRGSKASVTALLTFKSIDSDIAINKGDLINSRNGITFVVSNSIVVSSIFANNYRAIASKYRTDLNSVGIEDEYAVEVLCEASVSGSQGNISKFYLSSTSISGVSNVTNVFAASGGRNLESDEAFLARVLAIFAGANTGTAVGYRNSAKKDPSVIDAVVIEPGDSLMTRDGTQVSVAADGTRTILSEGTGGKVDVIVFGTRYQDSSDSYIYRDKSNTTDPTNFLNDYTLGQIPGDENKTVTRKRLDNLKAGVLPSQPVNNIVSVSGSLSGSNFAPKTIDELGRIKGNYELVKDTGVYAGSPWSFDRIHWINDRIEDLPEDKTKGVFNGQDSLSFTGLTEVKNIQQNIIITNENSQVLNSNRSIIQLAHYPVSNVTRVFNVNTGDRYVVTNQNPDGSGSINKTGRITISGRSLPAVSDVLQVDYTWVYSYDPYFDYDNRVTNNNLRTVQDSIDWGLSNLVKRERATLTTTGSYLAATVTHPISSIISVNVYDEEESTIVLSSGILSIAVTETVSNVISVKRLSDNVELWNTATNDGRFNAFTIYLPTDTSAQLGDEVRITYNAADVYNADTQGNFNNNIITIVPTITATAGTVVECNYIANISSILPATLLSAFPVLRSGNNFSVGSSIIGNQPTSHLYDFDGVINSNIRMAPSVLALNVTGSISTGTFVLTGTTIEPIFDYVYTVGIEGLTQDLSTVIKNYLSLNSKTSIPTNVCVAKLCKMEKVTTDSGLNVLSSDFQYDIKGYKLYDNSFCKDEAARDTGLRVTEITLPSTEDNVDNIPTVGDRIRVRLHIMKLEDTETVSFSKSGTQFTNKRFGIVDAVAISSGFISAASQSATLAITNFNQPSTRSRYRVFYDYTAPKPNERITISYNYDRIITDATLAIEDTRPINADVLIKKYTPLLVDVIMYIVVTPEFVNSATSVQQNVQDAVINALNATELATILDASDLEKTVYTVSGVDRVRIYYFNKTGETGSVLSIIAQRNEAITANNVSVIVEER